MRPVFPLAARPGGRLDRGGGGAGRPGRTRPRRPDLPDRAGGPRPRGRARFLGAVLCPGPGLPRPAGPDAGRPQRAGGLHRLRPGHPGAAPALFRDPDHLPHQPEQQHPPDHRHRGPAVPGAGPAAGGGGAVFRLPHSGAAGPPGRGGPGFSAGGVAQRVYPGRRPPRRRRPAGGGRPAGHAPGRGPGPLDGGAGGGPQGGRLHPAVRPGPVGRLPGGRLDAPGGAGPVHPAGQGPRRLSQPQDRRLRRHRPAIYFCLGPQHRFDRKNIQKSRL